MIDSPWKATSFKQHLTTELVSELMLAQAGGRGIVPEGDNVLIVSPHAAKVPVFNIPVTRHELGDRKAANSDAVFIDGRSFMKKDLNQAGGQIVNNQTQYDFSIRMAELTAYWVQHEATRLDLMRTSDMPASVFIAWISGAASRNLSLDEATAQVLQILTGIYYAHLYHDEAEATSPRGKGTITKLVQRWTRAPVATVATMVESCSYMGSLPDYIEVVKQVFAQNTRVSLLNNALIVMTLNKSWMGFGSEDVIAASLEYPAIFLALVEAASNSKVFRRSSLGRLVERFDTGDIGKKYSQALSVLVGRNRYPAGK
jgi:hypothetical protein